MPVLNESWSAIDAEGFVHVDMELDQELDGDLFFSGSKSHRRNSSICGEDCLKINNKSCKQVTNNYIDGFSKILFTLHNVSANTLLFL